MEVGQRQQIAARIRGLVLGGEDSDLSLVASRLRVDATSLLRSIDETAPYPTLEVIAAVVRLYGVDPCWLLTGSYDSLTHHTALDATTAEMPVIVTRMLGGGPADQRDLPLS